MTFDSHEFGFGPFPGSSEQVGPSPHASPQDWWIVQKDQWTHLMSRSGPFSVHHPKKIFTGRGWDAQSASMLFLPKAPRSILLLGLGGGTVARQCRAIFPTTCITGVEVDTNIIAASRRYFGLDTLQLEVVCCSEEFFLIHSRRQFDAIIDDAWPTQLRGLRSAVNDPGWAKRVLRNLDGNGSVAVNLFAKEQDSEMYSRVLERLLAMGLVVREVGLPGHLTTVLIAGSRLLDCRQARKRIKQFPKEIGEYLSRLRYRTP